MQLGAYTITITVDDQPLTEYVVEEEGSVITCWVASEEGKVSSFSPSEAAQARSGVLQPESPYNASRSVLLTTGCDPILLPVLQDHVRAAGWVDESVYRRSHLARWNDRPAPSNSHPGPNKAEIHHPRA